MKKESVKPYIFLINPTCTLHAVSVCFNYYYISKCRVCKVCIVCTHTRAHAHTHKNSFSAYIPYKPCTARVIAGFYPTLNPALNPALYSSETLHNPKNSPKNGDFEAESLKNLRDLAHKQMVLAKQLNNSDLLYTTKQIYSQLCADYCDALHKMSSNKGKENEKAIA